MVDHRVVDVEPIKRRPPVHLITECFPRLIQDSATKNATDDNDETKTSLWVDYVSLIPYRPLHRLATAIDTSWYVIQTIKQTWKRPSSRELLYAPRPPNRTTSNDCLTHQPHPYPTACNEVLLKRRRDSSRQISVSAAPVTTTIPTKMRSMTSTLNSSQPMI